MRNHRVMKTYDEEWNEEFFSIHEVFYDNETNEIIGWTAEPVDPFGETLEELKKNLEQMMSACDKPILDEEELTEQLGHRHGIRTEDTPS